MKTLCVHLPRTEFSEKDAFFAVTWDVHPAGLFHEMLEEMHESVDQVFALEIFCARQTIHMCVTADEPAISTLRAAIYSTLPSADIREITDFTSNLSDFRLIAACDIGLTRDTIYPLGDYTVMKYDTVAPTAAALSRLPSEDQVLIQAVMRPAKDTAPLHFSLALRRMLDRILQPFRMKYWFKRGLGKTIREANRIKSKSKLFHTTIRLLALSPGTEEADSRSSASDRIFATLKNSRDLTRYLASMYGGLSVLNSLDLNSFRMGRVRYGDKALLPFQKRSLKRPYLLSAVELASVWHLQPLACQPNSAQVLSLKLPPPKVLPTDTEDHSVCLFGQTDYREQILPFGLRRDDRRHHLYIVGKSGVGKSKLIELLARNDIDDGHGLAVLDPHGDLVDDILKFIPRERADDVVLFDPSDLQHPPSFNPLEDVPEELRTRVAVGFVEIFRKLFADSWSERLEHVMRYSILALLGTRGTTMLSISRMLTDDGYRRMIVENIEDPVLKGFWIDEFPSWSEAYYSEAILPLLDRVSHFLSTDMLRNVVGQPVNKFDFREIMDNQKILLMKVSTGLLGDENASLLGALVVRKIYQAAMSRAEIPIEQRQDFYFYVDEFHNFATSSFAEILGESRKYRLNLTLANQFLSQLPEPIRKAVFGNIGNLITFRLGANDSDLVVNELHSDITTPDVIHLALRDFYLRLMVDGESQEAFSGRTLEMTYPEENCIEECIKRSRAKHAAPIEEVKKMLGEQEQAA